MDPLSTGLNVLSSGMGRSAGPSMAHGAAYGSPVTVGGLDVRKPDYVSLVAAAVVGGVLVWLSRG